MTKALVLRVGTSKRRKKLRARQSLFAVKKTTLLGKKLVSRYYSENAKAITITET